MLKKIQSVLIILLCIFSINALASSPSLQSADKLFTLMNERLALMKDVAAYKFKHQMNAYDRSRELVVLNKSTEAAARQGLYAKSVRRFFQVQMNAAVHIERSWMRVWRRNGFPKNMKIKNLETQIRPQLITLGNQIIQQIITTQPAFQTRTSRRQLARLIQQRINVPFVSNSSKMLMLASLLQVQQQ